MENRELRIDTRTSTGDTAPQFEHQETVVNIERPRFQMSVHPASLLTGAPFGLLIVDHRFLLQPKNCGRKNEEAGISPGFYARPMIKLGPCRFAITLISTEATVS
jgi:hypothetical protein